MAAALACNNFCQRPSHYIYYILLSSLLILTAKLKEIESSTGYPAAWFGLAAFLLLTAVLSVVGGAKLLVDIVGFVYPAYQSFKSMDSVTDSLSTGDDTQWLTYWVVFSFLTILETVFGFLTVLIPFYYWIKIAVLVVRASCVRVVVVVSVIIA